MIYLSSIVEFLHVLMKIMGELTLIVLSGVMLTWGVVMIKDLLGL